MKESELHRLANLAGTPRERIKFGRVELTADSRLRGREKCDRWCEVGFGGNRERFEKRIVWAGWNRERVEAALGTVHWLPTNSPHPAWIEIIDGVFNHSPSSLSWPEHPLDEHPSGFGNSFSPFLTSARSRLGSSRFFAVTSDPFKEIVSPSAYLQLEAFLVSQFVDLCKPVFEKSRRPVGIADWQALLEEYPVLARRIADILSDWVTSTREFLGRIADDRPEIGRLFDGGRRTGPVVAILTGLSDLHNGRSVFAVEFLSGLRVVYKPRSLGIEAAFTNLVTWCNAQESPGTINGERSRWFDCQLRAPICLHRGNYGWAEFVTPNPCSNHRDSQNLYRRAGMFAALLHVLRGVDFHCENIIASGEHYILVDLEGLLHHDVHDNAEIPEDTDANRAITRSMRKSVLRTGLIPRWHFRRHERTISDVSPFADWVADSGPPPPHVPTFNGSPLSARTHRQVIVDGFKHMGEFLISMRKQLLSTGGPLYPFFDQPNRFLFRPTRIYASLIHNASRPEALRDGFEYGFELDRVAQAFLSTSNPPTYWPILDAELDALERGNVPHFTTYPAAKELDLGNGRFVAGYFERSSRDEVIDCLTRLDEVEIAAQSDIVRSALEVHNLIEVLAPLRIPEIGSSRMSDEQLLAEADRLAKEIVGSLIRGDDGAAKLPGPMYIVNAQRFQVLPLMDEFYGGATGVAVFLAAVDRATGGTTYLSVIEELVEPVRKFLRTQTSESIRRFLWRGIGAGKGLAGLIYAFVVLSRLTGRGVFLDDANRLAILLSPDTLREDRQFDLVGGTSGAILGLLALAEETGESHPLEVAILAGEHLLASAVPAPDGLAWPMLGEGPFTGFAHGTAGIAWALARLAHASNQDRFADAAMSGVSSENKLFDPVSATWRPRYDRSDPATKNNWSEGATGIGLSRLKCLSVFGWSSEVETLLRNDVVRALEGMRGEPLAPIDTLASGSIGRLDFLRSVGREWSRVELVQLAHTALSSLVRDRTSGKHDSVQVAPFGWLEDQFEPAKGYRFPFLEEGVLSRSLFQGTAGIGLFCLQTLSSSMIPSVATFD